MCYGHLNNCTLIGNSAGQGGGAVISWLNNCIVYLNTATNGVNFYLGEWGEGVLNYCCTTPLPTNGLGNITNAPLFVDYAGCNLRLQTNSACINAGNNSSLTNQLYDPINAVWVWVTNQLDLDGNPRVVRSTVDMGAYEFQGYGSVISYAWLLQYGLPTEGSADFLDPDHDGHRTWQEWRCLTDPTNALSVLRLLTPKSAGTDVTVSWRSMPGVSYFLERGTNLASPFAPWPRAFWVNLARRVSRTSMRQGGRRCFTAWRCLSRNDSVQPQMDTDKDKDRGRSREISVVSESERSNHSSCWCLHEPPTRFSRPTTRAQSINPSTGMNRIVR